LNEVDRKRKADSQHTRSTPNAVNDVDKDMKGSDTLELQTKEDKEQFKLPPSAPLQAASGERSLNIKEQQSKLNSIPSARGGKPR